MLYLCTKGHESIKMKKDIVSALLGALLSVFLLAGAYFLFDQEHIDKFLPRNSTEAIIYFPMLVVAPLSALFVHELGHLATGLALGQKLKLFVVAFFGIKEEGGKTKVFFNKNLAYFGGVAATAPREKQHISAKAFSAILIAGPISSFLYFVICLLVFLKTDSYLNSFFALSALTSLGLFLATTLPSKSGIMFTDRKRYQRLITKGPVQDAEVALYELISKSIIDNSFKNIEVEKTTMLENDPDSTVRFWAAYLRFMYFKENSHEELEKQAWEHLKTFEKEIPKNIWNTLKIS